MHALEQAALISEEAREALEELRQARGAIVVDPFAKMCHLQAQIEQLSKEEHPDPEAALALFRAARARNIYVRGGKLAELKPAIPLFRSLKDRPEALKFTPRPLITPASWRRKDGNVERMGSDGVEFTVPVGPENQVYLEHMKKLFARMPGELVDRLEARTNYDVFEAVWLGLHFMPQARLLKPVQMDRLFDTTGANPIQRGSGREFVRYDWSADEILLMEKSKLSERFIARLQVFGNVMPTLLGKLAEKYAKKA